MSTLVTLLLTALLSLAPSASLTVTPTDGLAPFAPDITILIPGPFVGDACLVIATPQHEPISGPFCAAVDVPVDEASVTTFSLQSGTPGVYEFAGFLFPKVGERIDLNHVVVTVTPHGKSA
jgi:hypothetical protein